MTQTLPVAPIYTVHQAAHILRVNSATLFNWLDGYERRGRTYPPVIRVEASGQRVLTWPEFVEAGWLREYRHRRVPLPELRAYIDRIREHFVVPYPLADRRPFVSGRELVEIADEVDLADEWRVFRTQHGQFLLGDESQAFVDKIEFDGDAAARYFPLGKALPVVVDPRINFGAPVVDGIRTDLLLDAVDAGQRVSSIAHDWGLDEASVEAAIRYEREAWAA